MKFDSLKFNFFNFLEKNGKLGNQTASELINSNASVFSYLSEFKAFLQKNREEADIPSSFTGSISDLINSAYENGEFDVESNDENTNFISSFLNDMFKNEDVKKAADINKDGTVSKEEMQMFLNNINEFDNNKDDISLEDLFGANDAIKSGNFELNTEGASNVAAPSEDTAGGGSVNGGGGGGNYNPSNVTNKEQNLPSLDKMTKAELQSELNKAKGSFTTEKETLSAILNGSDATLSDLKESIGKSYETYQTQLKEVDVDMAQQLDAIVGKIDAKEADIDAAEQKVSDCEVAKSEAETNLSNAVSSRDNLKSILENLNSVGSSDLTDEQKGDLQGKIAAAQAQLQEAEQAVTDAEKDLETKNTELEEANKTLETLKTGEGGLEELNSQKDEMEAKIAEAHPELVNLQNAYETAKQKYDETKMTMVSSAKEAVTNAQKRINDINTELNVRENQTARRSLKFSKSGELFDKDVNLTSEYVKHDGVMPYLVVGPEDPDPNTEYPVLLYLHGAGEFGTSENALRGSSMPYVLINGELRNGNDVDLANFNGYVLFPQANSTNWTDPKKIPELVGVLDDFSSTHNIDRDRIALSGHSMGGNGAQYMAAQFEQNDYGYKFNRVAVISGYDVSHSGVDITQIKTPMRGYVGTDDSAYMKQYFKSVVGEENVFVVNSGHGNAPELSYIVDADGDGCSDMFQWLFSDD